MTFIDVITKKAKEELQTIVLPETGDRRILEAAEKVLAEGIAKLLLIGEEDKIKELGKGLDLSKAEIIDPSKSEDLEEYVQLFVSLRKHKGVDEEKARETLLSDYLYYGVLMVKAGKADGMVAGAANSTANVLRPSLQILKSAPGTKLISSFFVMVIPNCDLGSNGVFVFSDCGLVQNPNSEELAAIAGSSAKSFELLVGEEPIVAMLSHSTKGSASHPDIDKVIEATRIAKSEYPDVKIDGECQFDAAVVPSVGKEKAPNSEVAGKANVLIFPDLDAGNIGYKIAQRLANGEAYGPICQGIAKPVNDLSRGCTVADIVGVIAITAVQASVK